MSSSKKKIVHGFFWTGIQLVVNQGFAFLIRIVLAKILFPEEFGVVGMATVFTGFVQVLNDLGVASALVQRKRENLKESHYHTAFWSGVVWSVALYAIMAIIIAPIAANFYDQPILRLLIPVLSIGILSSPINLVHKAQLTKILDFKKIAIIDNISNVSAGIVALGLAYWGAGVWSLAFNSVASILIAMPLYFRATGWIPRFIWDKVAFSDIFGFGIYTTGTNITNYWMQNLDYMLIGKFVGAYSLGLYSLAFILTDTFRMRLMAVINNVMFPIFSQRQDQLDNVINLYKKTIFYNCAISFPIMMFFMVLGEDFVSSFFGAKWGGLGEPLQILAVSVMFHMMTSGNNALIRAMGKPNIEFKIQLFKSIIYIPMLVYAIIYHGIIGAAWVVLINKILAVFFAQFTINRVLGRNLNSLLAKELTAPIFSVIVAGVLAYSANYYGIHIVITTIVLFLTYIIIIALMRKDVYGEVKSLILK
jgi:Membrane protein involved in the export of O-antigen and teichoic acid